MGLDNIPKEYPCKLHNTAILDSDGKIDCKSTQEQGKCPYLNEYKSDPVLKDTKPVYGMFGTDCWYRGKYGNYLLEDMYSFNDDFPHIDDFSFYGDLSDGLESQGGISAAQCLYMSKVMVDFTESWIQYVRTASDVKGNQEAENNLINDWIYAAWWLKFVGNNANGSEIWY